MSQHNTQAIESLYREHSAWLKRWLGRQRWSSCSVEDVTADVFLALLNMPDLAAVREPRAMMTTIARRLIYKARRRDDLLTAYQAELAENSSPLAISAEEQLITLQALAAIEEMLADLSPKARAAFLMSQLDGARYADIAAELKVSVSMVRKYVAQGLKAAYRSTMSQE